MKILILCALLTFAILGCSTSITKDGAKVKLSKAEPPTSCKELGDVSGMHAFGSQSSVKAALRNETAELGGNYVVFDSVSNNGSEGSGRAFLCPK